MAIAGSATVAYRIWLVAGEPMTQRTTFLSTMCDSPKEAILIIRAPDAGIATVQGSDMSEFWREWEPKQGGE